MTDDLVQFIRDRLDEEGQIAGESTPGPWRNAPTARHHPTASGRTEEAVFASPRDTGATIVAATGGASDRRNLANAEHIARHDPARVLADIEAKRRIVALHSDATGHSCSVTDETGYDLNYGEVSGEEACTTLRLLALPYAGHPHYRQEWRP